MKYFLAFIAFLLISSCEHATDTDELKLPPITKEGKGILACKINGDIYIAKGLGGHGMSFGDGSGVVVLSDPPSPFDWIRSMRTIPEIKEDEYSNLEIYVPKIVSVNDTFILSDKYQATYSGSIHRTATYDEYNTTGSHRGKVIILRNDATALSGTFEFSAYCPETNKIIHVTEGRFDIHRWY